MQTAELSGKAEQSTNRNLVAGRPQLLTFSSQRKRQAQQKQCHRRRFGNNLDVVPVGGITIGVCMFAQYYVKGVGGRVLEGSAAYRFRVECISCVCYR